jgi:hypothetical protein
MRKKAPRPSAAESCREKEFLGKKEACGQCIYKDKKPCGNQPEWRKATLENTDWGPTYTYAERKELARTLKLKRWFQRLPKDEQKDLIKLHWGFTKPLTLKQKIKAVKDLNSLPPYSAPPFRPGEVEATFFRRKNRKKK